MDLDRADKEWLGSHGGRFQYFLHERHKQVHKWFTRGTKEFIGMRKQQIKATVLEKRHTVIGTSPRFDVHDIPTTQYNYENVFREYWNFLAMLGAYASLIPLLAHSQQPACPSNGV